MAPSSSSSTFEAHLACMPAISRVSLLRELTTTLQKGPPLRVHFFPLFSYLLTTTQHHTLSPSTSSSLPPFDSYQPYDISASRQQHSTLLASNNKTATIAYPRRSFFTDDPRSRPHCTLDRKSVEPAHTQHLTSSKTPSNSPFETTTSQRSLYTLIRTSAGLSLLPTTACPLLRRGERPIPRH